MRRQKRLHFLILNVIGLMAIATVLVSCDVQSNLLEPLNTKPSTSQSTNTTVCLALNSRNWYAEIKTNNNQASLNISGEVDLPTPGYTVEWKPGILDRSQPPTQNLSVLFTPPAGIVIQVVTPTQVSFTMPSEILEYRSVKVYCGDQILADIPGVKVAE